jgi:predicted transcriptional regulator
LHFGAVRVYRKNMARPEGVDPFLASDEEVEVDQQSAAAIERGIRDADEGRTVSEEEARQRIQQWLIKSSTPKLR